MKRSSRWKTGTMMLVFGFALDALSYGSEKMFTGWIIPFVIGVAGVTLMVFGYSVCQAAFEAGRMNIKKTGGCISVRCAELSRYIGNNISESVVRKNLHYGDSEKKSFWPTMIIYDGDGLSVCAYRKEGTLEGRDTRVIKVTIDLMSSDPALVLRADPGDDMESPKYSSLIDIDSFIKKIRDMIEDHKFPTII